MNPSGEVQRVANEMLGRIVSGAYPAGLRLPAENDLAAALSCGRSTVREALRHLSGLGVVASRRGSGAMVLDFRREGTPALLPSYILAGRFDRPVGVLARELLGVRVLLAAQAVRLAARYAEPAAIVEARGILARASGLAGDPVAHGSNELDLFRSLVTGSGIWPAVWLANVFWAPMRELQRNARRRGRARPADYQQQMARLLDLDREALRRRRRGARRRVVRADRRRPREQSRAASSASRRHSAGARRATSGPEPRGSRRAAEGTEPHVQGPNQQAQDGETMNAIPWLFAAVALSLAVVLLVRGIFLGYPRPPLPGAMLEREGAGHRRRLRRRALPAGRAHPRLGHAGRPRPYMDTLPAGSAACAQAARSAALAFGGARALGVRPAARALHAAPARGARAVLRQMAGSRLYFRRVSFLSMRTMMTMGYLADPASRA